MVESLEKRIRLFFLDLDHTILDTAKLREEMVWLIGENGWRYKQFELEAIGQGVFTMEAVSHRFAAEYGLAKEETWLRHRELFWSIDVSRYVFPGVRELLAELKRQGYEIGIWSQGDPWWQRLKLEKSGLMEFIDPDKVLIGDDKIALLDQVPAGAMIVDDSPRNLERVQALREDVSVFLVTQEHGLSNHCVDQLCFQEI